MTQPREVTIQTLLLRVFMPVVLIVSITLGVFVYNRLYDTILGGFDRKLVTVSALTGALIDPDEHAALVEGVRKGEEPAKLEGSGAYQDNVLPMRRLVERLGLTYLYTQIRGGSRDIVYILDAATGEDRSPIGTEDDSTDDVRAGLRRVEAEGSVYVSPIEYQEQWGLSKASAAPMRDGQGRVVAMTGSDVNISIIDIATQNALLASAIAGMISLAFCAVVGVAIVSRVGRPIEALRLEALRIAAGDHSPPPDSDAPGEVLRLQDGVAKIAERLSRLLSRARERSARIERGIHLQTLQDRLVDETDLAFTMAGEAWQVIALGRPETDPLMLAFWAQGLQSMGQAMAGRPAEELKALLASETGSFLFLDASGTLSLLGDRGQSVRIGERHLDLVPGDTVRVAPGETVALEPDLLGVTIRREAANG